MHTLLRQRLLLVAITSTKRPPGVKLEIEKRLKASLNGVKVQKTLTHTPVSFVLRRNISRDGKQYDTIQESYRDIHITS